MSELKQVISNKIEKIGKINSKLTMIVPNKEANLQEQIILKEA